MSAPRRLCLSVVSALLLLALAGPARAWDHETHVAIAKAAMIISPAAEARVGAAYSEALWKSVKDADPLDPLCKQHAVLTGQREITVQAEQALRAIQTGKLSPYMRTQVVGRLIHFVADAAMPQALMGAGSLMPDNFFDHTRFLIYREPQGLSLPLAVSLKQKSAVARLSVDGPDNHAAAFRLAANLVADALLLLPPLPNEQRAELVGPAIFPVSRVDDGRAGKPDDYRYYRSSSSTGNPAESRSWRTQEAQSGSATLNKPLPDQQGLVVVEWNVTPTEQGNLVRALLFNNDKKCATKIVLAQGSWKQGVTVTLAPYSARTVELQTPLHAKGKVNGAWSAFECPEPYPPDSGVSTARRLVVPIVDRSPMFSYDLRLIDMYAGLSDKVRPGPAEGGVENLAEGVKVGQQPTPRATVITQGSGAFFGNASVGQHLRLTSLSADWSGCKGRARVVGSVRNISQYRLSKLKARLVIKDAWYQQEKTSDQIQSLDPSTLEPSEEAQFSMTFPCTWASYNGQYYAPVVDDVAGIVEQTVQPTPPR